MNCLNRSLLESRTKAEAEVSHGMRANDRAVVRIEVSLSLVSAALGASLASLTLPAGRGF